MTDLSAFPITQRWPAQHPYRIQLYSLPTPNGVKASIMLEETGLPYEPHLVDFAKDDQKSPAFVSLNPNGKIPAMIDPDGPGGKPLPLFESGAILLYLAEKTGKFLPAVSLRGETLSWLMFIATGVGPYSGQAVHFKHFAPKDQNHDYAHNRYQYETDRHYTILDGRLKGRSYMVGDAYSIVDMALWGWARMVPFKLGDDAFARYPNVKRLVDEISARPAAARAIALKDKFTFKAEMDDEARRNMFGHMATKVA